VARTSWLDEESNLPLIAEKVQQLEHFTKAMDDGVVEKSELDEQQERLIAAMKEVEGKLDDELHEKVTNLLVELTAYDIMRLLHEIQAERARIAFSE
jgi:hypothetical protein